MLTYDVVEGFTKEMSELYSSAFTEIEKVQEENILRTIGRGGKLIEYRDDGRFIGFTLTFTSGECTFWIYLATIPEVRGKGYGSKLIDMVRETHPGKRIFLVVEPMDVTSDDYISRIEYIDKDVLDYISNETNMEDCLDDDEINHLKAVIARWKEQNEVE